MQKNPTKIHKKRITSKLMLRSLILNVVNAVLLISTIFIFTRLPGLAAKIKEARTKELSTPSAADSQVLEAELSDNFAKLDQLELLFAKESRILDFVREIDTLKKEGVVTRFSFESNDVVQDVSKNFGLKIAIDFTGDLERVNTAINKVESLSYLIKPESAELLVTKSQVEGESDTITYRLKGVLYVDKSLSQNR
jgi:hypothetical protein